VTLGETGAAFEAMASVLYRGQDMQSVLQAIADHSVTLIPGCDHATVALLVKGEFSTVAASDEIAATVDRFERELGDGPCVDAIVEEAFQVDTDIRNGSQWPELAERVLLHTPVRGMIGYRLVINGRKGGALNVFSDTPGALNAASADAGAVLAAFASVAVTAAENHERAEQLQQGLESNREIGKAIGLLMAAHKVSADEAFQLLRTTSSQMNIKLATIAARIVAQGA
jgi:transcriptional regulator with GAF, ATPase, and Fis domain